MTVGIPHTLAPAALLALLGDLHRPDRPGEYDPDDIRFHSR